MTPSARGPSLAEQLGWSGEKKPISGRALRFHREQAGLSQRELGRRVAERLGCPERARAIQVRISRIESRP